MKKSKKHFLSCNARPQARCKQPVPKKTATFTPSIYKVRKVKHTKKQLPNKDNCLISFVWCHQESNRGHKDFQSFALPTELWHQLKI